MIFIRALALAAVLLVGACCPAGAPIVYTCPHATQAGSCSRLSAAIQSKCGSATPPMSCSALFRSPCSSYPNVCTSDTDNCVARITSTFTCSQALAVQCTFTCVN